MSTTAPRIGTIYYRVPRAQFDDLARFFGDQVGLPVKFRDSSEWVAFDGGGLTLALEGCDRDATEGPFLALRVADVAAARSAFLALGVVAGDITVGGHERRFEVDTPWGDQISVYQPGTGE
ncbi:VOC family protein [Nocardioides daeguensis]|uniref:VOC family protein n=1 Tax=Nocardioides daeguensis TaxID=908359 RepID=A0ABP6W6X6_9ACTN|nr:hypothetical protein [Nocardioides daeguensis]MBV6729809.1 hypothetical protein [Nocardioides daeguensis]MCR1775380.1 hypothetical protein [Nocardioides daeguensis]